jgi:hypothetical protein
MGFLYRPIGDSARWPKTRGPLGNVCVVVTSNMILTARDHLCMYRALLIGAKTVSKTLFLLSLTHKDVNTHMVRTHKQTTRSVQYTFDIMRGIHMAHENEKLLYLALC